MSKAQAEQQNVAFFFDCENLGLVDCDVSQVMQWVSLQGRPLIRRAYGDWSNGAKLKSKMLANAIELVEMPSDHRGKNRADIRMVVDAMEVLFTREHIDTFVIASGDSDFIPLLNRIRELGRQTIVLSRRNNTSGQMAAACDSLIFFDQVAKLLPNYSQRLQFARQQLEDVKVGLSGEGKRVTLDQLKKGLIRLDDRFCHTRYGFESFEAFVSSCDAELFAAAKSSEAKSAQTKPAKAKPAAAQPQPKAPKKEKLKVQQKGNRVPDELVDRIHWAVQILKDAKLSFTNLGTIHNELRILFPTFKVTDFGFSRSAGFRKVFTLMELDGWCKLTPTAIPGRAPWTITFQPAFFSRNVRLEKPSEYDSRLERKRNLTATLPGPTIPNPHPVPSFAGRRKSKTRKGSHNNEPPATILEFAPEPTSNRLEWFDDDELAELLNGHFAEVGDEVDDDHEAHTLPLFPPETSSARKKQASDKSDVDDWDYLDDIPF